VGPEALRAPETEFPGKSAVLFMHRMAYEYFTKDQRRSSIIASLPRTTHENATLPPPSSDFSSIGPSQSASQVMLNHDQEEQPSPEPATICSRVVNASAFGEPISPSIATTVAAPAPQANTTHPRSLSGNCITTRPSMRYKVATPAIYKLEIVTYRKAISLHVGDSGAVVAKEFKK
jgi:hypothetical protein